MFLKEIFPKYHIDEAKMDHIYYIGEIPPITLGIRRNIDDYDS